MVRTMRSAWRCLSPLLLAFLAMPTSAQTLLKAAPFGPPPHLLNQEILGGWIRAVEQATEGRVRVLLLPQAAGAPDAVFDAVREGAVDLSLMSNSVSSHPLPLNGLVGFSASATSAEAASVAYQRRVMRHRPLLDEFNGVQLLGVFTHGPGAMLLKARAPADGVTPAGMRLHAGGASAVAVVGWLDAIAVPGAGPAATSLLADGKVDGTLTALDSYVGFGLRGLVKSALIVPGGFYNTGFSLLMNRDRWAALPERDRAAIVSVSGESLARLAGGAWDRGDRRALDAMRADGVEVVSGPAALVDRMRQRSANAEKEWIDAAGDNRADAENALREYRRELQREVPAPSARVTTSDAR